MDLIRVVGEVRYWDPDKAAGLAVVDLATSAIAALGGLKEPRVQGRIGAAPFTSSVMPAGGGRLTLSVSKAMLKAAEARIGDVVEIEITSVGKD